MPPTRPRRFYVYIMSSQFHVLYVGLTNNLHRRSFEHKTGAVEGFSSRYRTTRLVYWESFDDVRKAIDREKQIKGWLRSKKVALIRSVNPKWKDLSAGWYGRQSDERMRKLFREKNPPRPRGDG